MGIELQEMLERLRPGDRVQLCVASDKTQMRYYGDYIGVLPGTSLLVTEPSSEDRVLTEFLSQSVGLKARLLLQGELFEFNTIALQARNIPAKYLHLELPRTVKKTAIRRWPRVSTTLNVEISGEQPFSNGNQQAQARLLDLSAGGALIETPFQLGVVGSQVNLSAELNIEGGPQHVCLPSSIRQIRIREDKRSGTAYCQHGVEFSIDDEQMRLALYTFVYDMILATRLNRLI